MSLIRFNGIDYPMREVIVKDHWLYSYYYFSVDRLHRKLSEATNEWSLDDCANRLAHDAYKIDRQIAFYVKDEKELKELSDEELMNLIN